MGNSVCKDAQTSETKISRFNCKNGLTADQDIVIEGDSNQKQPIEFSQIESQPNQGFQSASKHDNTNANFILDSQEGGNRQKTETKAECVYVSKFQNSRVRDIQGDDNYEPMSVSFSVIMLVIPSEIKDQILKLDTNFIEAQSNPLCQSYRSWKLQKSGNYSNSCMENGECMLIGEDQVYWGKTKKNTFIPEKSGIYFTKAGYYKGGFENGRASGKGVYSWYSDVRKQFIGEWKSGRPIDGELKGAGFNFIGKYNENGLPESGTLVLKLKKDQVIYKGKFSQGLFQDQKGVYECQDYTYEGGFMGGKKDGTGSFKQKSKGSAQKKKLSAPLTLVGKWKNDVFVSQK